MPAEVIALDHLYLAVRDLERSQAFYDRVMRALDFRKVARPLAGGDLHVHYFNRLMQITLRPAKTDTSHDPYAPGLHHVCFRVEDRAAVDRVAAELASEGIEATDPRPYPEYHDDYYATFLTDPDGIRLEVVNHMQVRRQTVEYWDRFPMIESSDRDRS